MFVRSLGLEESVGAIYISYENINDLLDKAEVSDWAGKEVELAIKTGLMQGVGENRFHPKGIAKKEQVAVVTGRFIEGIESIKQEITAGTNKVKYSELYNVLKNNSQAAPYKGIIDLDFTINMTGRITGEKISVAADVYNMVNGENFHSTSVVSMKMFDLEPFTEEMEYLSLDGKFYEKNHETKAWEEKQDGQQIVEVSNGYGLVEQSFLDNFNMYLIENQGEEFSGSEKLTKYTVEMDKEAFGDVMLKEEIEGLGVSLDEMLDEDSIFRAEYFINSKGEIVKGTMDFTGAFDSGEETVDMNINMSILLLNRGQEYVIKIP